MRDLLAMERALSRAIRIGFDKSGCLTDDCRGSDSKHLSRACDLYLHQVVSRWTGTIGSGSETCPDLGNLTDIIV